MCVFITVILNIIYLCRLIRFNCEFFVKNQLAIPENLTNCFHELLLSPAHNQEGQTVGTPSGRLLT